MTDPAIVEPLRRAYPKALARLARMAGTVERAEDVLHDALEQALVKWPADGVPDEPAHWLITVARNRMTDGYRRQARYRSVVDELASITPWRVEVTSDAFGTGWRDDLLRLLVTCCDPVLAIEEQAALTLSTVGGLSVNEIARAFLTKPKTMEQRLTRARRRLRERREAYDVPDAEVARDRLEPTLAVIHLLFNEGYWSARDDEPIRRDLCTLAGSLCASLSELLPDSGEVMGLLALLMLHEARVDARLDDEGRPVPLPEQDRNRWDHVRIAAAVRLLEAPGGIPGPYRLEAGIAAAHCRAPTAAETDWALIAALYERLERWRPTPVVRINRAFAVGQSDGAEAGLLLMDDTDLSAVDRYPYVHLVRAALCDELDRFDEADAAYERAASLATNEREAEQIREKRRALAARRPS